MSNEFKVKHGLIVNTPDGDNTGVTINQNDVTNSPDALVINNTASGLSIKVNDTDFGIDSEGNVGIGGMHPNTILYVTDGPGGGSDPRDNRDMITLENDNHCNFNLIVPPDKNAGFIFSDDVRAQGGMVYDHNLDELKLVTNGAANDRVIIDSDGNVGITELYPSAKFDVRVDNNDNVVACEINQNDDTNDPDALVINNTTSGLSIRTNTDDFVVDGDGNVGIGTAYPLSEFHIMSPDTRAPTIIVENTNEDDQPSRLNFYKNSASPADEDVLYDIRSYGYSDAVTPNSRNFTLTRAYAWDVTDGAEAGRYKLGCMIAGAQRSFFECWGHKGTDSGEAVINENGQDIDFRIESNFEPNAFFFEGSSGTVIMNGGAPVDVGTDTPRLQLQGIGTNSSAMMFGRWQDGASPANYYFVKSRNTTPGSFTIVQDNDEVFSLAAQVDDGTDYATTCAKINAEVDDASPAASQVGGALTFYTAAGASDDDITERMRIDKDGNVGIGTTDPSQALDLIGSFELENTTTATTGVIYKGSDRFIHNFQHPTGDTAVPTGDNTFVGKDAGNFTVGSTATETYHGSYNTALGVNALSSNTTGYWNTAVGMNALYTNTIGYFDAAFGTNALYNNTEGYNNTALGTNALYSNTTGSDNTAVGRNTLYNNTTGYLNTAIGRNAGRFITGGVIANETSNTSFYLGTNTKASADGNENEIVIGYEVTGAGSNTVTLGNDSITDTLLKGNVGIGTDDPSQALDLIGSLELEATTTATTGVIYKGTDRFIHSFSHPTGDSAVPAGENIFIGFDAGNFTMGSTATIISHGSYNTAIGTGTLYSNTTGYTNSALGRNALYSNTEGYNNMAFGLSALFSNTTGYLNVAVGSRAAYYNTTGYYNLAFGAYALWGNTTGYANVAIGRNAGRYITGGSTANETSDSSFYLGADTMASADGNTNEIVIGNNVTGAGSNTVTLGNDNIVTTLLKGDVGIGTSAPTTKVEIAETAASCTFTMSTYSSTNGDVSSITLAKSSSDTVDTDAETASNENFGQFAFNGVDSNNAKRQAAYILSEQEGAAGANNVPGRIIFGTGTDAASPTERMRIDSDGAINIGGGNVATARLGMLAELNVSANYGGLQLNTWSTSGGQGSILEFNKSASATIGTHTLVSDGDTLGWLIFRGTNGSSFRTAADIKCEVDGDPFTASDASDMPGRLTFGTSPDGTSSPVERMRIANDGGIYFYNLLAAAASTDVNINGSSELHSVTSSRRYKKNIKDTTISTKDFDKIKVREYDFREENGGVHENGIIAEELEEIYPEFVYKKDIDGELLPDSVQYSRLCLLLIKKVQEQQEEIDTIKKQLNRRRR